MMLYEMQLVTLRQISLSCIFQITDMTIKMFYLQEKTLSFLFLLLNHLKNFTSFQNY